MLPPPRGDYDATISFGLPFEPEDSQYGEIPDYSSTERELDFIINFGIKYHFGQARLRIH